ncbi:MAG: YXWGXW repeat-containing protein [Acidobacteriota bacterium]|nr:YXWGXW repeat-containing protein [Acidobacteriota bacterium]
MKSKLLALALFAGSTVLGGVRIGVEIGAPPPPPRVHFVRPVAPGPNFIWVNGYYEIIGNRYHWREGYWSPRPHPRAVWIAPRYHRHRYYPGYWR